MMNLDGVHLGEEVKLKGIRNIVFPQHTDHVRHIAVDIGGSLVKVAYFTRITPGDSFGSEDGSRGSYSGRMSPSGGGRLNFTKFETAKIGECISFLKNLLEEQKACEDESCEGSQVLLATGGGAHKYHDLLVEELNVKIEKFDEMECLVKGVNFLVKSVPNEVFAYADPVQFETTPPNRAYPYMLVNIGSGVSILKVTGENEFERVSGTSLGGGTFWGLLSLISCNNDTALSFEDMLALSTTGENANVDMLVGDIYGMDYGKIGLKSTTIASSFGKIFKKSPEERRKTDIHDVSRSLLYMVSNNIGQIAYLNARAHGINRIYFGGYFICGHPITMHTLSYAINFWSKGETRALFFRHEGYLGAVGAFLQ